MKKRSSKREKKQSPWKFWTVATFGFLLIGVFLIRFSFPSVYETGKDAARELVYILRKVGIGREAPDFLLETVYGEPFQLSELRGKIVVLVFSTTWCPDCRAQLPLLEWLIAEYPHIVLLDIDTGESIETVAGFLQIFPTSYPVLVDENGAVAERFLVSSYPTLFLIDSNGIIRAHLLGETTQAELSKILDKRSRGGR